MITMRAKFKVDDIKVYGEPKSQETITMSAVCPPSFDANGHHEDNSFSRWTPTASLSITITNPTLFDQFERGDKFYLDFTRAES